MQVWVGVVAYGERLLEEVPKLIHEYQRLDDEY